MNAFHGSQELKNNLLIEVEKHRVADQIVSGTYGREGSGVWVGCGVGCSIQSYNNLHRTNHKTDNHASYEPLFGIPQVLARLEDCMFEGMPAEDRAAWPGKFFSAIEPGSDLSTVWPKFAIWLLVDPDNGVIRHAKTDQSKAVIERVAELYRISGSVEQFREALRLARAAAEAAADAANATAYAAAVAAYAAAYAAHAAANAAANAAAVAAAYAAAANAYAGANARVRQKACKIQAEKLLELMAAA